ncbi:MAG: beta-lactamase family protein [bacterium]|nr:beta-lactamase family protein [bacterium]
MKYISRSIIILLVLLTSVSVFAQNQTLSLSTPEEAGMSAAVLESAVDLYRKAVENDHLKGCVLLVAYKGKVVVYEAIGYRNVERKLPFEKDTMFRMASNTKPVVATAVSILVEQEKLNYDANVRNYIPAFDNYKSGFIKIRHLLSHTSGFRINSLFLYPFMEPSEEHPGAPTLTLEANKFGEHGPDETPGTSYSYSNPGFNTLGALVEIQSGKLLADFLRENIYEHLGMKDTYNLEIRDVVGDKLDRMGVVYRRSRNGGWRTGWKPGDRPTSPFPRASGGLISTAWDYAVFCQMFLNRGIYNGKRILKGTTVDIMTQPHTAEIYAPEDREKMRSFYGYGWSVAKDGVYSHGGSDGTNAYVDPENDIVGIIFTQSPGGRNPMGRFMELIKLSINR